MRKAKRRALETSGWRVGSARQFLGLTDDEAAFIELRFSLSRALKERRMRSNLTQADVAARIRSSQSRVAKMEAGDPSVSVDLLVRTLLALGASRKDLARSLVS